MTFSAFIRYCNTAYAQYAVASPEEFLGGEASSIQAVVYGMKRGVGNG